MKTVTVNANALRRLLSACISDSPMYSTEMWATRNLPDSPVKILVDEFNAQAAEYNSQEETKT